MSNEGSPSLPTWSIEALRGEGVRERSFSPTSCRSEHGFKIPEAVVCGVVFAGTMIARDLDGSRLGKTDR